MKAEDLFHVDLEDPNNTCEHNFCQGVGGVKLHYVRKGHNKPTKILLLHGWPGFWFDWRFVIQPLAEFADVIVPDFRGFGDSEKPDIVPSEGYTPDILSEDILSVLNHAGVKNCTIVAHDIGATIAQILARKVPDRIQGLLLCNPPYPGIGERRFEPNAQKEFWYQSFHNLNWAEQLIGYDRNTVRFYLHHFYSHWIGKKEALSPEDFETIVDQYAKPDAIKGSISYYRARAGSRQAEASGVSSLPKINTPTYILWGEADPVIPSAWSDRLEDHFENYQLKTLPGIGHFVSFEAPDQIITVFQAKKFEQ